MRRVILKWTNLVHLHFRPSACTWALNPFLRHPPEFDNQTNGTMTQADMDIAAGVFSGIGHS